MANKKTKKKHTNLKKTAATKSHPVKKVSRNKLAKKKFAPKNELAKKRSALKVAKAKTKAVGKERAGAKTARTLKKRVPARRRSLDAKPFELQGLRSRSAGQSGDLQGLSTIESADSESVDELIEEGNVFEADVVAGVESAGDAAEKEVRTHEVPEDDVPGEYLGKE
jgi:hypothetical protein